MSFYKQPSVLRKKCLGHGISPTANTAAILGRHLSAQTAAVYVRYRPIVLKTSDGNNFGGAPTSNRFEIV